MGSTHSEFTGDELHIGKTQVSTGNPNGVVTAGVIGEFYWDSTNDILYVAEAGDNNSWIQTGIANDQWTELTDTPGSISANLAVQGNSGGTALEFGQNLTSSGTPTFTDLTLTGDLTVQGTTVTLDAKTLLIEDKNIELGNVAIPTDVTADGGGITLKASSDITILWRNAKNAWDFNQSIDLLGNNLATTAVITAGQVFVDNLQLDGNTFSSTDTNGDILLTPNGTGNVGIGETNPTQKLEVNGNIQIPYENIIGHIQPHTNNGAVNLNFGSFIAGTHFSGMRIHQTFDGTFNDEEVAFHTHDGGVSVGERVRINKTGNVGIGTLTPSEKLEINGQIKITGGNPGNSKVLRSDANGVASWGDIGWTDLGTDVVLLNSSDDVGIGTAIPGLKLHVLDTGTIQVRFESSDSAGGLSIKADTGQEFQFKAQPSDASVNPGGLIIFDFTDSRDAFVIDTLGKIGMGGITAPTEALDVNGNIKISDEVRLPNYPNTRDDGTPINILGTDVNGNLISGPNEVVHIGGNFTDTTDQSIAVASTAQTITFNQNRLIDDIGHTINSDTFTINTSGVYQLMIAPQLGQGANSATVEFWVEKNGVDIVDSNIQLTISPNSQQLPFLRWKERFVVTDTFKINWASDSTNTKLDNITSAYGGPNIPSVMLGVTHQGS